MSEEKRMHQKRRFTRPQCQSLAEKRLKIILDSVLTFPALKRKAGGTYSKKPAMSRVDVSLIGARQMSQLNAGYRNKAYATDVLSFSPPEIFRNETGYLGELVICFPVLKTQAKSLGHSAQLELDILLVHGVLHLLGFDHEQGPVQARQMARWESRLLEQISLTGKKPVGLVRRASI